MRIIVDTLNSRIETDNTELLQALYSLYAKKSPGYQYSSAYRNRRWDGKVRFISKSGTFRTGLLERVLTDLQKIKCSPQLEIKNQNIDDFIQNWDIEGFIYYDYQRDLIEKALENKRGIVKSPTGSGKTLIIAALVKALAGRKMVLLFNAKQLLTQTYDFLTKDCGIPNIGLCFGEGYIYGDIILCTVQSIEKILDTHYTEAQVLMVDECHEFANGRTTLEALRAFPNAPYRFGFTATPPSDIIPQLNLEGSLGPVWTSVSTSSLVDEGKLTKPIIQLIDRPYTASGADEEGSYLEVYGDYIVNNDERNNIIKDIANDIKQKNKRARILILTKSLDHGRTLENLLGGGD